MHYAVIYASIIAFIFGGYLPYAAQSFLYSVSLSIKGLIIFLLPVVIFSFLFSLIERQKSGAVKLLIIFLMLLTISNTISISIANFVARLIADNLDFSNISTTVLATDKVLYPLWEINWPTLIPNKYLAIFSIAVAGITVYISPELAARINKILQRISSVLLNKVILLLIPIFIFGTILKISYDGLLIPLFKNYYAIFCIIIAISWLYILAVATIVMRGGVFVFIKNMLPTIATGFTTMSGSAALPLLFKTIVRATKKESFVDSLLPTAANFHPVGDCFIIPILSIIIFYTFNGSLPGLEQQFIFIAYSILAKYSFAAVPGGGMIIMLPVLQQTLGFDQSMTALIISIYVFFDPIATATNLIGNCVFIMLLRKILDKPNRKNVSSKTLSNDTPDIN